MTKLAFVDCETTGLDPQLHYMWELAIIVRGSADPEQDGEWLWQRWPDNMAHAEAQALNVSRFYERCFASPDRPARACLAPEAVPLQEHTSDKEIAADVAVLLSGAYLVASNPSFDAAFIDEFLRVNGHGPAWKYHLIDVRALAIGRLAGSRSLVSGETWATKSTRDLFANLGLELGDYETHTALGDARLARDVYDVVLRVDPTITQEKAAPQLVTHVDSWFAENMARVRGERKIPQADLAAALAGRGLGIQQQTLSTIESGKRPVRLVEALAIAEVLDVPLEELTRPPDNARGQS